MTKDIEREHTKYLAELLKREVIKKVDFEDIVFKSEINAFHSNYLSARFMDNINFGWSSWQAAKAHEAKKLEGCVVVPVEPTPKMIDSTWDDQDEIETMSHNSRNEFIYKKMIEVAMLEAARGGNE